MPSEIRHILFRPAEAARAMMDYARRQHRDLPQGDVVECFAQSAGGQSAGHRRSPGFCLVIDPSRALPRGQGPVELVRASLDGDELMAALIAFCDGQGIALPRGGEKSLQRFGEQIGMVITLDDGMQEDWSGLAQLGHELA